GTVAVGSGLPLPVVEVVEHLFDGVYPAIPPRTSSADDPRRFGRPADHGNRRCEHCPVARSSRFSAPAAVRCGAGWLLVVAGTTVGVALMKALGVAAVAGGPLFGSVSTGFAALDGIGKTYRPQGWTI